MIFVDALYGLKVFWAVFVLSLAVGLGWQVARLFTGTLVAHYNGWVMQRMEKKAREEHLAKYPNGPPPTPTMEQVYGGDKAVSPEPAPIVGPYL